jgi:hypothetical protein
MGQNWRRQIWRELFGKKRKKKSGKKRNWKYKYKCFLDTPAQPKCLGKTENRPGRCKPGGGGTGGGEFEGGIGGEGKFGGGEREAEIAR